MMIAFRALVVSVYTIPRGGVKPLLVGGDRVVVNRWSYGLRAGGSTCFSYARWMGRRVGIGDLVAFNYPLDTLNAIAHRPLMAAFCKAAPGDTVHTMGRKVVCPGKCRMVRVDSGNINLLCNTYRLHEKRRAEIKGGNLYVDGKYTRYAYFSKDYYWLVSHDERLPDSRFFGFVPEDHIIGRVSMVFCSKDDTQPFYKGFRKDRWLILI